MKDPAFTFYTSDFLTGVANLTMKERGQYITLLCLQHQLGHLSMKIIKLNIKDISQDVLKKFKKDDDENYYNERLEFEINKREKYIQHQRENGKKGGRPKSQNKSESKSELKSKKKPLENENENDIDNDNKNNIENKYFESLKVNTIFNEFLELRKKLKAVNTDRAINMLINKLNEYDEETQYEMIEQSIINSWKGIFELKNKTRKKDNFMDTLKEIYSNEQDRSN